MVWKIAIDLKGIAIYCLKRGLSIQGLWVRIPARPSFFPRICKSQCDIRHSSSTNRLSLCGKATSCLGRLLCGVRCEKTRKCMSRWTSRRDITENLLKTALNPNQSNEFRLCCYSPIVLLEVAIAYYLTHELALSSLFSGRISKFKVCTVYMRYQSNWPR